MRFSAPSRASDPDFVPSLVLLMTVEEYSLEDVGSMFGVSRERVRQWSNKYHIKRPPRGQCGRSAIRVWDDSRNRFVPVPRSYFYDGMKRGYIATRKQEISKRIQDRRDRMVTQAVELKAVLGRDPTTIEMAEAILGRELTSRRSGAGWLAGVWGGSSSTKQRYRAFRAAIEANGVATRKAGMAGAVSPRTKKLLCKRGHSVKENRDKFGVCKICRNWRQSVEKARKMSKPIPPEPIEPRDEAEQMHLGV